MATFEFPGLSQEAAAKNQAAFDGFASRYRTDGDFRAQVDANPGQSLSAIGFMFPPGMQVRLAADTDDVMHIVMPSDPNVELADETLAMVAGGSSIGTAGTAGTLSTALTTTMVSTLGTAGCASTAGSS
jgi:hypothetical protein